MGIEPNAASGPVNLRLQMGALVAEFNHGLPIWVCSFRGGRISAWVEFQVAGRNVSVAVRPTGTFVYLGHDSDQSSGITPVRLPRPQRWGFLPGMDCVEVDRVLRHMTARLWAMSKEESTLMPTLLEWLSPPPGYRRGPVVPSPGA